MHTGEQYDIPYFISIMQLSLVKEYEEREKASILVGPAVTSERLIRLLFRAVTHQHFLGIVCSITEMFRRHDMPTSAGSTAT